VTHGHLHYPAIIRFSVGSVVFEMCTAFSTMISKQ